VSIPQTKSSRLRLVAETCLVGTVVASITSTVQTLRHGWLEANDLPAVLTAMPLGFVLYSLVHPAGWLFWIGLASVLWNRSRRSFFVIVISAAIWFGTGWPTFFAHDAECLTRCYAASARTSDATCEPCRRCTSGWCQLHGYPPEVDARGGLCATSDRDQSVAGTRSARSRTRIAVARERRRIRPPRRTSDRW